MVLEYVIPKTGAVTFLKAFLASMLGVEFLSWITKYVFSEWQFLAFLVIAVTVDTVMGMVLGWSTHKFSIWKLSKMLKKMFTYGCFLIMLHGLTHVVIDTPDDHIQMLNYIVLPFYMAMMVMEAISIARNAGRLGMPIPQWFLKRLIDYNENGFFIGVEEKK